MKKIINENSLYISNSKELSRVLNWTGIIIFWLTFWLPNGIFLGGNSTNLGVFFETEVVLPISFVGILIVFLGQFFFNKNLDKEFFVKLWHGLRIVFLWLLIIAIIAVFSRDFKTSSWFLLVFLAGMMTIPINKNFFSNNLYKNFLILGGVLTGFFVFKTVPDLNVSQDLLSLVSVLGLAFLSDSVVPFSFSRRWENSKFREILTRIVMQIVYLFVVFQSDNLIFHLLSLIILFFSGKIFIYRRGRLSPDVFGIIIFAGFFIAHMFAHGIYKINLPITIPHFWLNFREILLGVGQGQFLPALQASSDHLILLTKLQTPNSGFLITLFEQGVLGVFAMLLFFLFSYYLHAKRSRLYILIIFLLWMFSREFMVSENGIILLILFLFLNIDWKISREFHLKN
jgi:hypothetical protein